MSQMTDDQEAMLAQFGKDKDVPEENKEENKIKDEPEDTGYEQSSDAREPSSNQDSASSSPVPPVTFQTTSPAGTRDSSPVPPKADSSGQIPLNDLYAGSTIRSQIQGAIAGKKMDTVQNIVEGLLKKNETLLAMSDAGGFKPNSRRVKAAQDSLVKRAEPELPNSGQTSVFPISSVSQTRVIPAKKIAEPSRNRFLRPKSPTRMCNTLLKDNTSLSYALMESMATDKDSARIFNVQNHELVCAIASKSLFSDKSNKLVTTLDANHFWCNFCTFTSTNKTILTQHLMDHRFSCKFCAYESFCRSDIIRHMNKMHSEFEEMAQNINYCTLLCDYLRVKARADGKENNDPTKDPDEDVEPIDSKIMGEALEEQTKRKKHKMEEESANMSSPVSKSAKIDSDEAASDSASDSARRDRAGKSRKSQNPRRHPQPTEADYDMFEMEVEEIDESQQEANVEDGEGDRIMYSSIGSENNARNSPQYDGYQHPIPTGMVSHMQVMPRFHGYNTTTQVSNLTRPRAGRPPYLTRGRGTGSRGGRGSGTSSLYWSCGYCNFQSNSQAEIKEHSNREHPGKPHRLSKRRKHRGRRHSRKTEDLNIESPEKAVMTDSNQASQRSPASNNAGKSLSLTDKAKLCNVTDACVNIIDVNTPECKGSANGIRAKSEGSHSMHDCQTDKPDNGSSRQEASIRGGYNRNHAADEAGELGSLNTSFSSECNFIAVGVYNKEIQEDHLATIQDRRNGQNQDNVPVCDMESIDSNCVPNEPNGVVSDIGADFRQEADKARSELDAKHGNTSLKLTFKTIGQKTVCSIGGKEVIKNDSSQEDNDDEEDDDDTDNDDNNEDTDEDESDTSGSDDCSEPVQVDENKHDDEIMKSQDEDEIVDSPVEEPQWIADLMDSTGDSDSDISSNPRSHPLSVSSVSISELCEASYDTAMTGQDMARAQCNQTGNTAVVSTPEPPRKNNDISSNEKNAQKNKAEVKGDVVSNEKDKLYFAYVPARTAAVKAMDKMKPSVESESTEKDDSDDNFLPKKSVSKSKSICSKPSTVVSGSKLRFPGPQRDVATFACSYCPGLAGSPLTKVKNHLLEKHPREPPVVVNLKKQELHQKCRLYVCLLPNCHKLSSSQAEYEHHKTGHGNIQNLKGNAKDRRKSTHLAGGGKTAELVQNLASCRVQLDVLDMTSLAKNVSEKAKKANYQCLFCTENVYNETLLGMKAHYAEEHKGQLLVVRDVNARKAQQNSRIYVCEDASCEFFSSSKLELEMHCKVHKANCTYVYECAGCGWYSSSYWTAKDHLKAEHAEDGNVSLVHMLMSVDEYGHTSKKVIK